jgi:cation diffusion facilitator CzcD-associated flavoprotein CzcO
MAGLLSAIKLREAGFTDITVYEKADRLGGTWRENTYPGIACDVPSYLYTYSFVPNPDWSHAFSPGAEILGHLEAVANRHGVAGLVRYGTEVVTGCADSRSDGGLLLSIYGGDRGRRQPGPPGPHEAYRPGVEPGRRGCLLRSPPGVPSIEVAALAAALSWSE